jgi:hypothetical protein
MSTRRPSRRDESRDGWCGGTWKRSCPTARGEVAGAHRTASPKRLAAIDEQLPDTDPLSRLHLTQERMVLEEELAAADGNADELEELEAAFIEVAAAYGERRGLTYEAWRSIGVAPRVLKAAGIGRGQ